MTKKLSNGAGPIIRRFAISFGVLYFFWLVFYFDFLRKSVTSVDALVQPYVLTLTLASVTGLAMALAVIVSFLTRKISDKVFLRGAVTAGALLNISSLVSIGLKSTLAWISLGIVVAATFAVWRISARRIAGTALLCGVLITGYALIDQTVWSWTHHPVPERASAQESRSTGSLPSVYMVVMDEFPLSLINNYASFMSLPNLSRLAAAGIFLPRAYAINDSTEWSLPAIFTGRYLDQEHAADKPFRVGDTAYRNLATDLAGLGYRIKVYNDVNGLDILELPSATRLETQSRSKAIVTTGKLVSFAGRHFVRQLTFGLYSAPNIGNIIQGQAARGFKLGHDPEQPQFVYIHLFDAHHNWVRNRDGSFNGSPYVTFTGNPDKDNPADAPSIAANAFEQYLWADANVGPLVDALLAIPPDQRIIVFTSDHGISWREPPFGRGQDDIQSTKLQVPAVIIAPGVEPQIDPEIFPLIDLYPTLIDVINRTTGKTTLVPPESLDGISLFSGNRRQERGYYAYCGACKYRLEGDEWVLDSVYKGNSEIEKAPVPARELALTPDAEKAAFTASAPRSIPPMSPARAKPAVLTDRLAVLVENYKGFTIIGDKSGVYGFSSPDGAVELAEDYLQGIKDNKYFPVFTGKSVREVADAIDSDPYIGTFPETVDEIELGYEGFNILANRGVLYAVLQIDGAFDRQRLENGPYAILFKSGTQEGIKGYIRGYLEEKYIAPLGQGVRGIVSPDYKGFIIVETKNGFYGFPAPDGTLETLENYITNPNYYPVYAGKSGAEITAAIDSNLYAGTYAATLLMIQADYRGFDILANKGMLYAVLRPDGAFDYKRLKNGPYIVELKGKTLDEVRQLVDSYLAHAPGS